MTIYQKMVLRGLWIIIKLVLKTSDYLSGTDEVMWALDVSKALGDDKYRNI